MLPFVEFFPSTPWAILTDLKPCLSLLLEYCFRLETTLALVMLFRAVIFFCMVVSRFSWASKCVFGYLFGFF